MEYETVLGQHLRDATNAKFKKSKFLPKEIESPLKWLKRFAELSLF